MPEVDESVIERLHVVIDAASISGYEPIARSDDGTAMAFWDAWMTNIVEGVDVTLSDVIPLLLGRPLDPSVAHQASTITGLYTVLSDPTVLKSGGVPPANLRETIVRAHAIYAREFDHMAAGRFKRWPNQVGDQVFTLPELVESTLAEGVRIIDVRAEDPWTRALASHWLISSIHPFADGNGRASRMAMNLILTGAGLQRIIVPPQYFVDGYIAGLRDIQRLEPVVEAWISFMEYAQTWTSQLACRSGIAALEFAWDDVGRSDWAYLFEKRSAIEVFRELSTRASTAGDV